MQTRQEFLERLSAAKSEENRVGLVAVVVLFLGLFAQVPLYLWFASTDSLLLQIMGIAGLFLYLAGWIWLMIWYLKNRAQRFGLVCTGCGKAVHGIAGESVAQWGNCPYCQTAIWMEQP